MKRTLFAALTALTILAAAFFAAPSGSADGLTKSKAAVTFNKDAGQAWRRILKFTGQEESTCY